LNVEVVNHEATGDSPSWNPPIAAPARFLIPERLACREIFSKCLVTTLKPEFFAGHRRGLPWSTR